MSAIPFRIRLAVALGASLLTLTYVGVLSYQTVRQENAEESWVEHTYAVMQQLDTMRSDVLAQEVRQRDVLLAGDGDKQSWQVSTEAFRREREDLEKLRKSTADNPLQRAALSRLEHAWQTHFELFARNSGTAEAQKARLAEDQKVLEHMQSEIRDMQSTEQGLLASRLQAVGHSTQQTKIVLASGFAVALILLLVAGGVIFREFAKRKESEDKLRGAEERYHLLFDKNPLPVWVFDRKTLFLLNVNEAAVRHYGYSRQEFLRLKITDLRPLEDIPAVLEAVSHNSEGPETSGPWRHLKKSGEVIYTEITSHPLTYEGQEARLVVATDITKRKQAEDGLRRSEELFRLLVSGVKDYAILMLDPEGYVVSWNAGAERIKGYAAGEIVGKHFAKFYRDEDVTAGKPEKALQIATEEGRFEEEGWRVRKDGTRFWANVVITAVRDPEGYLRGFAKMTRDVTERKAVQEKLAQHAAELESANKELEAFSYSVSHDLRAPLRAIDGFSQALLEDCEPQLDAAGKDYLKRVIAATKRMGDLIDDLLNLSRVARTEMRREEVNISDLAETVANGLRSAEPARKVEVAVTPELRTQGDARLLRVVLENLMGNAWKFTGKKAEARIEFGKLPAGNGHSTFFVRDNGAGFDMAHAARLFGAFQRLHGANEFPGTGIGLATVQRIIHRHGGKVWAEGEVGKGSTIYFSV